MSRQDIFIIFFINVFNNTLIYYHQDYYHRSCEDEDLLRQGFGFQSGKRVANFLFSRHHFQHFDRLRASLKDLQIKRD